MFHEVLFCEFWYYLLYMRETISEPIWLTFGITSLQVMIAIVLKFSCFIFFVIISLAGNMFRCLVFRKGHYTYHGNMIYFCIFAIITHIRCLVFGMCGLISSIIGANLPISKEQSTGPYLRVKGIEERVMDLYDWMFHAAAFVQRSFDLYFQEQSTGPYLRVYFLSICQYCVNQGGKKGCILRPHTFWAITHIMETRWLLISAAQCPIYVQNIFMSE